MDTDLILEVQVRTVYGVDRIYPMNELAKKLTTLLDKKTFDKRDLGCLKDIGYTVKWVPITLPE